MTQPMVDLRIAEAPDIIEVSRARERARMDRAAEQRREEQERWDRMNAAARAATEEKRVAAIKEGRVWEPPPPPPAEDRKTNYLGHAGLYGTASYYPAGSAAAYVPLDPWGNAPGHPRYGIGP